MNTQEEAAETIEQAISQLEQAAETADATTTWDRAYKKLAVAIANAAPTLREGLAALRSPAGGWIAVAPDSMPPAGEYVALRDETEDYLPNSCYFDGTGWRAGNSRWPLSAFTHWFPLPSPPTA